VSIQEFPGEHALHLVMDNSGTHKEPHVQAWLKKHPRFICHFVPTSSSWLNLVERWFEELSEKAIRRGSFVSIPDLQQAITTNSFYETLSSSSIAYGNGQFVMVGLGGTMLTSADGMSWNQRSSGTTNHLSTIAFSGNRFVVGGDEVLLTSTNAIDWVQREPPPGFPGFNGFGMAYGNGRFVLAGWGFAATSTNGLFQWTRLG
jgi:hypothetical protein